jgi:hypothetical protein
MADAEFMEGRLEMANSKVFLWQTRALYQAAKIFA